MITTMFIVCRHSLYSAFSKTRKRWS